MSVTLNDDPAAALGGGLLTEVTTRSGEPTSTMDGEAVQLLDSSVSFTAVNSSAHASSR